MNTESKATEPQTPQPISKMVEVTIVARFEIPTGAEMTGPRGNAFLLNGKEYQFHVIVEENAGGAYCDLNEEQLAEIGITYGYVDTRVEPVEILEMQRSIVARFVPQAWVNGYAMSVDPEARPSST